jgi:hypothetical protein
MPMNFFGEGGPWVALCMAMAVAIVILLRRSYRYFGRRSKDNRPVVHVPRADQAARGTARDAEAQWLSEEVRMHETARELSARLDSKISILEYLTGMAQQQIERLETLLDKAQQIQPDDRSNEERNL